MRNSSGPRLSKHLLEGHVTPAHPLALNADLRISERYQRALTRYYLASGVGGLAVGVHTTQFEIREHGLLRPVLQMASEAIDESLAANPRAFIKVAGICGQTTQASGEAGTARSMGYDAGLLSLAAWSNRDEGDILQHCRAISEILPIIGFYLQPSVGGRLLSHGFWNQFAEIENVIAIKIAPFNRYQTLDVVRAVAESGRDDIALYTGNDDNIILDLLTRYSFDVRGKQVERQMVGGLLGQWAVWTHRAVQILDQLKAARKQSCVDAKWLTRAAALTDANAAIFDAAHHFAGCIPGIHEILRRQGLLPGLWCLNPDEVLSPGQSEEIDRIWRAYPDLRDTEFVEANLDEWLA